MFKDRLLKVMLSEMLKELTDAAVLETDTMKQSPAPREMHMISTGNNAPLFFSPNEEKIIELLKGGPLRQNVLIQRLELEMNATTLRELLSNLVKRRVITNGPDGYELIA
jgi:hypothetical protein